ncbi:MAG TPA: ATP-binding cassette domain-containing protein [Chloroflexota bacterium]|nr:ATP-binding cassette domain-containing protein [Chloroflexota bacterium]
MTVAERLEFQPAADPSASPAIAVRDLEVRYDEIRAVDGISFDVHTGEVFGLLGPNGAGKTTTIRVLTTLLRPDAGYAAILGMDVDRFGMAVRQVIGYVPQQLSIDAALTGWENVWLFARLFDVPRSERRDRIDDALETVGLMDAAGRLARTYSGGMVRRLELAQALVNRPRLLILDEPTIGLDPVARGGVWERVESLRMQYGMTVLLTTHYMDEADALCDRLAIMHHGLIRAEGTPLDLKNEVSPDATLDDVFRHYAGGDLSDNSGESLRQVRSARRTARRLG